MPSWVSRSSVGSTNVKTKKGSHDLTALERSALAQTVAEARRILAEVMGLLTWNVKAGVGPGIANIDTFAARYFKTGGGLTTQQRALVLSKMELVHNALQLSTNVKLTAPTAGALGSVRYEPGARGILRGIFEPGRNLGTRAGETVSRGDIRVKRNLLGPGAYSADISNADLAVITFIHEAHHKYASLADHGDDGYIYNDGSGYWDDGLTTAQALNNADTYAWFCFAATR